MDQLRSSFKINEKRYDRAVETIRVELGSYDGIAAQCYSVTGASITGNAVRRWFMERCIPIEYAALLADLTLGQVSVLDFYPWLTNYTK